MQVAERLKAAVAEGIIDAQQAERLGVFLNSDPARIDWDAPDADVGETESVRFARGLHDIFLTLGIIFLFVGLGMVAWIAESRPAVLAGSAVLAWLMAEYITGRRRLVLPSIALAVAFVGFTWTCVSEIFQDSPIRYLFDKPHYPVLLVNVSALLAASLFYARFRLPFSIGLIAAEATLLFVAVALTLYPPAFTEYRTLLFFVSGLGVFAAAMAFDLSDPERETLRADNAFWLHLLAAPLLVHSTLSNAVFARDSAGVMSDPWLVIALFAVLALVALVVDRRALLVAGLAYLGIAIGSVFNNLELGATETVAATLILLGVGVVLLGSGWQSTRRVLFRVFPLPASIVHRLPPIAGTR